MDDCPELSFEEEVEMAERECWKNLGITFKEFRHRWFRGDYRSDHRPEVTSVAFYIHGNEEQDNLYRKEFDCD